MNERTRRNAMILGAIVLALLSIGGGALIALSDDDEAARPPSPTPTETLTPTPSPDETPSPSPTPRPPRTGADLEDGRHFVYVETASRLEDGSTSVTFDLAYFLTGAEGQQAAAEHDDEFLNGYYIVNDNPRLRTIPLADEVAVSYVPTGSGSDELQPGNIDAWLESVLETNQTDYDGKNVPWWFTVEDGQITQIEQQWLP